MLIPSALKLMIKHRHIFPANGKIVDLGDQLLYSREHATQILPALAPMLANPNLSEYECVSIIYKHLGLGERNCIDYSENADIRINLNHSALALPGLENAFDVVTNQGFSEHVFNQYAVFECIHHICKPGGLMIHVLPCQGWADGQGWGHGFFQYQPNFFRHLASINNYEIIDLSISPFSPSEKIYDFNPSLYSAIGNPHLLNEHQASELGLDSANFVSLLGILKKPTTDQAFRLPHE